ncbi:MAG: LysM peptidoglycan-binding domain-containing protein [Calditrichae bacterium]|nr:LysM peptidoglycan-binding domain-containing protein [Calditrichia bacterium]
MAQKTHPAEIVSPNSSFESESTIHTVRYGDTLWDIAKMYNVSIGDIKKWNGKRGNKIRPGDKLKILRK